MFGIDSSEFALIALVALVVIGPKDLPRVMRMVGQWVAKGRSMTRHVRAGFDEMMRQAELDEMQKQWAEQNEAIMKATALPDFAAPYLSAEPPVAEDCAPVMTALPEPVPDEAMTDAAPATAKPRTKRKPKTAAAP